MATGRAVVGRFAVLLVLAMVVLSGVVSTAAGGPPDVRPDAVDPGVAAAIADVSLGRIYSDLYALQNFSTRYAYSTGFVQAGQYVFDRFSANPALRVSYDNFTLRGVPMRNVVAVLQGTDPTIRDIYVVGAHYDSTSNGNRYTTAPGADDDGSGTAGVLEAARVLSRYRFNATIVFGAWGAEEEGLVGSGSYCSCLAGGFASVGLEINLDMIGNDPLGQRGLRVVHDLPSDWAADRFIALAAEYGVGLAPAKTYDLTPNSDHASFWAQGWPAVLLIERDFSPYYHTDADTIDRVSMGLVTETTRGAVATLASLAGIHRRGEGIVSFDRNLYGVNGTAGILLDDADLNTNPAVTETATARAASPREPGGVDVLLRETGPDTGLFAGSVVLTGSSGIAGALRVAAGDAVTVRYIDASPPGVHTDTAAVDVAFRGIRNVAVTPDVTTATVTWETTEPADAVVAYGRTLPPPSLSADPRPRTSHRVELVGLSPDTAYRLDVRSTDDAGQTALADNGGLHFGFHTLTGVAAVPDPGHAGYVRLPGLPANYFTSNRMISGYSARSGATYLGSAQFNTTAASIPAGAVVTGASVRLWGQSWVYNNAPGTWRVQVLNASVDPGWTSADYATIAGAAADFQVLPALGTEDLAPGEWASLTVPAPEYARTKARVGTGALSIRIEGPTGGAGSLFDWATGYPAPCSVLSPGGPELSVTYSLAGDALGPRVSSLRADPNPVWAATSNLSATVTDAATGGTPIAAVEAFVDADPGVGRASPMGAADNGFDSVTEKATRILDVSSLSPGSHNVSVRAQDRAGNWGPASTFTLYVGARDPNPPRIVALIAEPPIAELGLNTTLGATVSDDLGVVRVDFEVWDGSGSVLGNFTAALNVSSGRWELRRAYPRGIHAFTAWALDTGGNVVSASGDFEVRGAAPRADAGPDLRVERGRVVTLDGRNSSDDVAIARWEWTVTGPGGTWTFHASVAEFAAPEAGVYVATLRVWDGAGRTGSDTAVITVTERGGDSPASMAPALLFALAAVALVVAAIAAARWVRRREEPPRPPG